MRINRVLTATVGLALAAAGGISAVASAAPPAGRSAASQRAAGSAKVDRGLGNGLGRLLAEKGVGAAGTNRVAAGGLLNQSKVGVTDSRGRVLVQLTPQAGQDRAAFRAAAERAGLQVVATEDKFGMLEGFVAPAAVKAVASVPGVGTIAQSTRARKSIGAVTSQGRAFQRVTALNNLGVNGTGVTVGALSDSYDTATTTLAGDPLTIHAAQDVASGDLPGVGNPTGRTTPVTVVDDAPAAFGGEDEGRGMLQIVHDLAPNAKLCFATAFRSELSFAANIRALGDPLGACKANVIVDDVSYFDEPFFSQGLVGDAVDAVAANGVSYFTSAGNNGDRNSWRAPVKMVTGAAATTARTAAKLSFVGVDPALYSGGFQDFNTSTTAVDIAQNLTVDNGGGLFDMQWNDPTDYNGSTFDAPISTLPGTLGATPLTLTYTPTTTDVGKLVQFKVDDATVPGGIDLVLTVTTPSGRKIGPIDTGTSPETAATRLVAGAYKITVAGFGAADVGPVVATVSPVLSQSKVTSDFNALFFDSAGKFVSAIADVNQVSGRPIEISGLNGPDVTGGKAKLQLVIAASGPVNPAVTEIGYINNGGIYTTEYGSPTAPAVYGHATADGATAVAAFDTFRSYLPEFFTSPGGNQKIYYDSAGNKFATPKTRQVPQIASTDGVNTTFFGFDSFLDTDTRPNFFGTSAAAPHAAAIAALMLQKAGGPTSLTPAAVRTKMKASTFTHDLDPNVSVGKVGTFTITARGAQGSEGDSDPGAMASSRFFDIQYTGTRNIRKITFFGETASPTARKTAGVGGIVFDTRPLGTTPPYVNRGFPFTIGAVSGGLTKASVSASFSVPVPVSATRNSFRHMTITFSGNGLNAGERLQFGVDRDLYTPMAGFNPSDGNGADELGGAYDYGTNTVITNGMKFVATRTDGTTFTGFFRNKLGKTWSPLDGFGVVDATAATTP